ncbi:ATP/GTP-binding protein [Myceligenerans xiligouense]|uniref:ATP/GTP-binding protein n=1 Tax=Myceligenerans xiligouense TaxID=253184 RepID=UPI000F51346A|nr:ATP/GTP-binding protein [Myceligenerans xiligouense]
MRALFRSNDRRFKAVDVFTNREGEWAAVTRSLAYRIEENRASTFDVEDLEAPRRNVMAFYGVGGIGKTALSHEVVERLSGEGRGPEQWPAIDSELGRFAPVRIDLSAQAGVDLETILLSLRVRLAELGRPMPAFDLAFHRYWEHNHPGESLADYLRRSSFFGRISSAMSVPDQIQEVLADVAQVLLLPGSIGALVGQTLKLVVSGLRDRQRRAQLMGECTRLPDLLEAEPDTDALSYYAHLLSWDLAQLPAEKSATLVVLLDTFEDVGDRSHRDVERLIQRVAWLMPNALFIITGRNRLQWDDEHLEGQLDWVGPRSWPLLAPSAERDPRQHRIGYLTEKDCQIYLSRRLTLDAEPLMTKSVRDIIVRRSHGLPLYLDLAVMRFLDLYHQRNHVPDAEEFNHDFPALVARTFRDLTLAERQVLRAVSLLDAFSISLAAAATAGLAPESATRALVERPFIEYDPTGPWPYYLHNLVQSAIREADSTAEDRWSRSEWKRAAGRTLAALGDEYRRAARLGDRRTVVACLRQGLRLARDFSLDLGWLVDASYLYVEDSVWEPIDIHAHASPRRTTVRSVRGRIAVALAESLDAIARRQRQHRQLTLDTLEAIIAGDVLPDDLTELPLYFIAECHRDIGNLDQSLAGMRRVAALGGRLAPDANRGLLHLARRLGQFPDVLAAAGSLGQRGHKDRTLGDLWWTQASIVRACDAYARERDAALRDDHAGEAAVSQACLAFSAAFQDRARALEQVERARRLLAGSNSAWSHRQLANAELLCDAGIDPSLPSRVTEAVALAEDRALTSITAYARFALCFHAAILADRDMLEAARTELRRSVKGKEFSYLLEASYFLADESVPNDVPRADWIDGPETTRARWRQLVHDRTVQIIDREG